MKYLKEELLISTQKQKKKTLLIYFIIFSIYLAVSVLLFCWYKIQVYKSPTIKTIKAIHYSLSVIMAFFSFIYLGIVYKRVNCFYKALNKIKIGIKETYEAEFIGYDETSTSIHGVEYKSLVFKEWNKYKKDYYERKVKVFNELDFPVIEEGKKVKFITQANILVEYEYITENE